MTEPLVAVVGRPNVGKSTLVNRIVGGRPAIVQEQPGVTRDRKELDAQWRGRSFRVVDTGGWLAPGTGTGDLARQVSAQAEQAIAMADLVLLVVDAVVGITEEDAHVAGVLQRASVPVLVVANKVDDDRREAGIWELCGLGLGDPIPVSATHGRGSGDLLDAVVRALEPSGVAEPEPGLAEAGEAGDVSDARAPEEAEDGVGRTPDGAQPFAVAIVGRPNVGKSTLFNRLVGESRAVVHHEPGTTRDSIDTVVETADGPLRFVDTAGMRRQTRIDEPTEYYGLLRALEAIDRADGALFVIDASAGVTHQDQRLAERVDGAGSAIVVVLNKWDLLDGDTAARAQILADVGDRLGFLAYAPVLKVSAGTGRGLRHVLPALRAAEEAYHRRVPTAALNRLVQDAQAHHPPPAVRGHHPRILYATQGANDPPTFTVFVTHALPATYVRYLEHRIREAFDLGPTPIKLRVRRRGS